MARRATIFESDSPPQCFRTMPRRGGQLKNCSARATLFERDSSPTQCSRTLQRRGGQLKNGSRARRFLSAICPRRNTFEQPATQARTQTPIFSTTSPNQPTSKTCFVWIRNVFFLERAPASRNPDEPGRRVSSGGVLMVSGGVFNCFVIFCMG